MRRSLIVIVAALLFVLAAPSQIHYDAKIEVGIHGGLDLSQCMFTPSVTQSFIAGANAGIGMRYIEENHFGFIVEANFAQRGWQEDFDDKDFVYKRTANFVEVPFLAHIYFGRRGRFFINAGPSVSLFVGESTHSNFDYTNPSAIDGFPTRITYQYTMPVHIKMDYGISGGLGGEFSFNRSNAIFVEARYYFGLGNLLKSGRSEYIRGSNPMTISVNFGYWFRVK